MQAYPLLHTSKSFEPWLAQSLPVCIEPVWGARMYQLCNVMDAARTSSSWILNPDV
jgi:hypothetical protein